MQVKYNKPQTAKSIHKSNLFIMNDQRNHTHQPTQQTSSPIPRTTRQTDHCLNQNNQQIKLSINPSLNRK